MFRWLKRLHAAGDPDARIEDALWREVTAAVPWVAALDAGQGERLRALAQDFLRSKDVTAAADLELGPFHRTVIAALCTLPVLRLGLDWLDGWHQVIVYPGSFGVRRHHHDESTGVVHEWDDELAGESWDRGPMVLSWADIEADLAEPDAGFCVAVHEIAHKLDALDGTMDGTPPLPDAGRVDAWVRDFQAAYDALCADLEAGREPPIDDYAAESPDEFFAVASEYHFSAPQQLAEAMPAVARQLAAFYGPSPFAAPR